MLQVYLPIYADRKIMLESRNAPLITMPVSKSLEKNRDKQTDMVTFATNIPSEIKKLHSLYYHIAFANNIKEITMFMLLLFYKM